MLWSRRGSVQGKMTWVALLQGSGARVGAGCHKYMQRRCGSGAGEGTGGPVGVGTAANDGCGGCKLQVCRSCWTAQTMAQPRAERDDEGGGGWRATQAQHRVQVRVWWWRWVCRNTSGRPKSLASRKKGHRSNCQAGERAVGGWMWKAGERSVGETKGRREKLYPAGGGKEGRTDREGGKSWITVPRGTDGKEKRMKSSATRKSPR